MKKFIWIFCVNALLIDNCFAEPAIGDKAVYLNTDGREVETITFEVINRWGQGKFVVRYRSELRSATAVMELPADDPKLKSAQSIENCRKMISDSPNGIASLETLEVNGQSIATCHIFYPDPDSRFEQNFWFGDVPFGLVKKEIFKDSNSVFRKTSKLIAFEKR